MSRHAVDWVDAGREPQCAPNPAYPRGVELDVSKGALVCCDVTLPYPARRCGYFLVTCEECGLSVAITTAGRSDDPRAVRLPCRRAEAAP